MHDNEYEIIHHNNSNFHLFLVDLLYRTPHIHKDFEISLVLEGSPTVIFQEEKCHLQQNDIFIVNPFMRHEITATEPTLILSLQISPNFFSSYYPQIENTDFDLFLLNHEIDANICKEIQDYLLHLSAVYFGNSENNSLKCAILINQLFLFLLENIPYHLVTEQEKQASLLKGKRMRKIMHYIDEHYNEKLLLSDITALENLDLYYLSHFFKESFGITFQSYLSKIRCEHARQLLLLTNYSLLDISITCGFSDPKYFNKAFQAQYECSPKEYRKTFHNAEVAHQQKSMLTTQKFLSSSASLEVLQNYQHFITTEKCILQ